MNQGRVGRTRSRLAPYYMFKPRHQLTNSVIHGSVGTRAVAGSGIYVVGPAGHGGRLSVGKNVVRTSRPRAPAAPGPGGPPFRGQNPWSEPVGPGPWQPGGPGPTGVGPRPTYPRLPGALGPLVRTTGRTAHGPTDPYARRLPVVRTSGPRAPPGEPWARGPWSNTSGPRAPG